MSELTDCEVMKYLLFQQFYYGNDQIFGRTREISETIPGCGAVIEQLYGVLEKNIQLIRERKFREYLEKFAEAIYPINIDIIFEKIIEELDNVTHEQQTPQIITSVCISGLLMNVRKGCFEEATNEIRIILIEKMTKFNRTVLANKKIQISEDFIELKMDNLKKLFSLNDPSIGMIYNLCFLKTIAFKFMDKRVHRHASRLLQNYMEIVVDKIY
jgi:hypothetical protein